MLVCLRAIIMRLIVMASLIVAATATAQTDSAAVLEAQQPAGVPHEDGVLTLHASTHLGFAATREP